MNILSFPYIQLLVINNYLIFYQPPSAIDEKVTTSNASDESSNIGLPRDAQDHFGSSDAVNDDSIIFPPNNLPPPAHVFWYRG